MNRSLIGLILCTLAACSAQGQQPDLTLFILPPPATNQPGDLISITVNVSNLGDASAASGYVDVFLNNGSPSYSPTNRILQLFYTQIEAGGYDNIQASYQIPEGTPPGTYYLTSLVDATDYSAESNEFNNNDQASLTILPAPEPDLVVASIKVDPSYAWHPSAITVELKNQGATTAAFSVGDRLLQIQIEEQTGDVSVSEPLSIDGGATYSANMNFTISSIGAHAVLANADPDNVIAEAAELNNSTIQSNIWMASSTYDTDGDGMVDADEVMAGSDPDNVSSIWKCTLESSGDGFMITWPSISNRWYVVERATDLSEGFVVIADNLPAVPPENSLVDNMASNAFYRISVSYQGAL